MSPVRLPRWTTLLVPPLLVGAVLLMHGLDGGTTTTGVHRASAGSSDHAHPGEAAAEHHDGCPECVVGHVMAACVAIVATVVGVRLARRAMETCLSALVDIARGRVRAAHRVLRPPDPAWVRLAVMRC